MLGKGKKTRQWERVRAEIKEDFRQRGITRCEICNADNFLTFAHRLKRRFITDEAELRVVALLCQPCHEEIEHSGHEQMYQTITNIIMSR